MEFNSLRYVTAVAETGNFSQAAQMCHVGQPALSQQIAKLENELGVRLFYRHSRGASLTEAGERFVEKAKEILRLSDDLRSEMYSYAGFYKGSLVFGVIPYLESIAFGNILSSFVRRYPDISVTIRQAGGLRLLSFMADRTVDLAFLNRPLTPFPDNIAFEPLSKDRYDLAVPYTHPLARRDVVSLSDLAGEPLIAHETSQVSSEVCAGALKKAGIEVSVVCRSGTPNTVLYMVQAGIGIALVPSMEFGGRALADVRRVRLKEEIPMEVGIAWRKDTETPLIRVAVRLVREISSADDAIILP